MPEPGDAAAPAGTGADGQANHVVGDDGQSIPDKGRQTSAHRIPVSLITAERPDRLAKYFHYNGHGELLKEPGGHLLQGYYERQLLVGLTALVGLIEGLAPNQALCFGIAQVENAKIVCQHALKHGAIARTREFFDWPDGSGILMLDYDPRDGKAPLDRNQLLESLFEVCPALREAPMAVGASGSTFIYDSRTNVQVRGPGGLRIYILVKSAKDIPRAGKVIFERLWLAGYGYVAISKSGRMLLRTLVDAAVWQPERLDFAAGAACELPLEQRRPPMEVLNDGGDPFDTVANLPDLNAAQRKQLKALQDEERERCKPDADRAREAWAAARVDEWLERHRSKLQGLSGDDLQQVLEEERQRYRRIAESCRLPWDFELIHQGGATVTVGEILGEPKRWHGERFADPLEPEYCNDHRIAYANLRSHRPYIYSHAHGGMAYRLLRQRRTVHVAGGRMPQIIDECDQALLEAGDVYQRCGALFRLVDKHLVEVKGPWLRTHLELLIDFVRATKKGDEVSMDCPTELHARILANRGSWSVPKLRGIVLGPVLRPDGSVLVDPGYDAETGILNLDEEEFDNDSTEYT